MSDPTLISSLATENWRKSSYSGNDGCVEFASTPAAVGVRDGKDREGPRLVFTPTQWSRFVHGVVRDAHT